MSDILDKIVATKKIEIAYNLKKISLANQREIAQSNNQDALLKLRGFILAIENKISARKAAVIAEIKKASPSKGVLRENFRPTELLNPMKSMALPVYQSSLIRTTFRAITLTFKKLERLAAFPYCAKTSL